MAKEDGRASVEINQLRNEFPLPGVANAIQELDALSQFGMISDEDREILVAAKVGNERAIDIARRLGIQLNLQPQKQRKFGWVRRAKETESKKVEKFDGIELQEISGDSSIASGAGWNIRHPEKDEQYEYRVTSHLILPRPNPTLNNLASAFVTIPDQVIKANFLVIHDTGIRIINHKGKTLFILGSWRDVPTFFQNHAVYQQNKDLPGFDTSIIRIYNEAFKKGWYIRANPAGKGIVNIQYLSREKNRK